MEEPYLQASTPSTPSGVPGFVAVLPYKLGEWSYVSEFTHISQNTRIGKFCSIGNLCTIGAQKHPLEYLTSFPFLAILAVTPAIETVIGNDVWIGCNSVVMAGVTVGDGAVIGAGAVVTKSIPPYAIAVGNPARVLRYRFDAETIMGLLETRWWDLPLDTIKALPMTDPASCIAAMRDRQKFNAVGNLTV